MKKFILCSLFVFLLSLLFIYLNNNVQLSSNEKFVKKVLHNSNYHLNNEKEDNNLVYKFINEVSNVEINKPTTILETSFAYVDNNTEPFLYITNDIIETPRVYIYNSHPIELYDSNYYEGYDINPGVVMAGKILQDKLNNIGIETIVEEKRTTDYLKEHNLSYNHSYTASREYLTDTLKIYPNLELIIDLHRDAGSKNITTASIDGIDYAKVMFVQNKKCEENFELATSLNNMIKDKYPNLSRGLYTRHEFHFNQDLNPNAILIELGGNLNTINEVVNTIDVLVEVIEEKLN